MGKETVYNISSTYYEETDELYTDVGANAFALGTVKRGFVTEDFAIRTASGGSGTLLSEGTDYELLYKDNFYTSIYGEDVYTSVRILNATYQSGNLYFSYKHIGSYVDSSFLIKNHRGMCRGFEISKTGDQEITITIGDRYLDDGTRKHILHLDDFEIIGSSVFNALTASKWYPVLVDSDLTIEVYSTPSAGTSAQRPTDDYYGYNVGDNNKYRHDRGGYYIGNKLVIGHVYLDASKYVEYIINNYSGADEAGENELGTWERSANLQKVWATKLSSTTVPTAVGSLYRSGYFSIIYPVEFYSVPKSVLGLVGSNTGPILYAMGLSGTVAASAQYAFIATGSITSSVSLTMGVSAYGPWHA